MSVISATAPASWPQLISRLMALDPTTLAASVQLAKSKGCDCSPGAIRALIAWQALIPDPEVCLFLCREPAWLANWIGELPSLNNLQQVWAGVGSNTALQQLLASLRSEAGADVAQWFDLACLNKMARASVAKRFQKLVPQVLAAHEAGYSHSEIHQFLFDSGLGMTFKTYKGYLLRYRRQLPSQPNPGAMPASTPQSLPQNGVAKHW